MHQSGKKIVWKFIL